MSLFDAEKFENYLQCTSTGTFGGILESAIDLGADVYPLEPSLFSLSENKNNLLFYVR